MVRSFTQAVAWAKATPTPHQGGSWDLKCEQFVNNAGGFNYGFTTAKLDYQTSVANGTLMTPAQLSISSVPTGWLLYWDYGSFGHVAFKAPGNKALMASSFITERINGSNSLGYISAPAYQTATGHKYLGASPYHGPETLNGISVLTSADKTWIKDAITSAVTSALNADHTEVATAVWAHTATSPLTKKSVSMVSQLLNSRKEISNVLGIVTDIQATEHTPGE